MAFRKSVPQSELRAKLTEADKQRHGTTYQASRGGHYPTKDKPVPGTPKQS